MPARKRVLIVEDHDASRRALTMLLGYKGFDVEDYDRCTPAEPHLAACDIDVALLDVRLPGRCGDDFGRELRHRCANVMIVFITGESALEPLKVSVPDCFVLRKPVDVGLLLKLLECLGSKPGCDSNRGNQADHNA